MKERRISPRAACTVSLAYKLLKNEEFQKLSEVFSQKRTKIVLYDKLVHENKKINFKLHTLENDLEPILSGLNDQLKFLIDNFDINTELIDDLEASDVVFNSAGMEFTTYEVLKAGKTLEVQIRLEPGEPRVLIMAEVLRSRFSKESNSTFTAVSFTYIEPEDKLILHNFFDEHK